MAQKLILPFTRSMMLCGYKNPRYQKHWGYPHYGIDISTIQGGAGTNPKIYASGEGVVVAAGRDEKLGGAVAVLYSDVIMPDGTTADLIGRYMHLRSVAVKLGERVKTGSLLGVEGKEGTGDYHLHLEFDTDTKYPVYSPQVAGSNFWKKGTDSTVNPSLLLHIGAGQSLAAPTYNPEWLNKEDLNIPALSPEPKSISLAELGELLKERGIDTITL